MRNFKSSAIFCGCIARFVSDLVGNPEDRFSRDTARISPTISMLPFVLDTIRSKTLHLLGRFFNRIMMSESTVVPPCQESLSVNFIADRYKAADQVLEITV